jgi:hypothetical protein
MGQTGVADKRRVFFLCEGVKYPGVLSKKKNNGPEKKVTFAEFFGTKRA